MTYPPHYDQYELLNHLDHGVTVLKAFTSNKQPPHPPASHHSQSQKNLAAMSKTVY
jgi:hypothetical protein